MTHTIRALLALLALTAGVADAAGLDTLKGKNAHPITHDEARLLADVNDGRFTRTTLEEAALIASGLTAAEQRKPYLEKIQGIIAAGRRAVAHETTDADKAQALLHFMHRRYFKKGHDDFSSVPGLLDRGEFNCISSTIVYTVVGQRLGLDLRACLVPGHVFAVLTAGGKMIDIETTSAWGFDPDCVTRGVGGRILTALTFGRKKHTERTLIREAGLIGGVYNNRAADTSMGRRDFLTAAHLAERALKFDGRVKAARLNLALSLRLLTVERVKARDYSAAAEAGRLAVQADPADPLTRALRREVYVQWAVAAAEKGGLEAAREILDRGSREDGLVRKAFIDEMQRKTLK